MHKVQRMMALMVTVVPTSVKLLKIAMKTQAALTLNATFIIEIAAKLMTKSYCWRFMLLFLPYMKVHRYCHASACA